MVGLASVHPLIGLAEGADFVFHLLHQCKSEPLLGLASVTADRTIYTDRGQSPVEIAYVLRTHSRGESERGSPEVPASGSFCSMRKAKPCTSAWAVF